MIDEISLKIDLDRITLNDLIMLESQNVSALQVRGFLARCAMNSAGEPMGELEATVIIGNMPLAKIKILTAQIAEQLREINEVPPTSGGK